MTKVERKRNFTSKKTITSKKKTRKIMSSKNKRTVTNSKLKKIK